MNDDFNQRTDRHRRRMSEEPRMSLLEAVLLLAILWLGAGRLGWLVASWM
jgi:hypothetical protein